MADIDIQKKSRGGSIWPWVLGLLIAAALIWLVVEAVNTDDDNLAEDMTVEDGVYPEADDPAMTDEVYGGNTMGDEMGNVSTEADEYLRFIDNMDQQGDMGPDHEFTASALMHLSEALGAVVDAEGNGDIQLESTRNVLEQRAQEIQQDPTSTTHANSVQAAFTAAADLMGQLQEMRFPDLSDEVSEVQQAAQAISPSEDLLEQRSEVRNFFTSAGDALEQMSEQSNEMASGDL